MLNKLKREVYALTFGPHHIPAQANNLLNKKKRLNYKQYEFHLNESGDMALNIMHIEERLQQHMMFWISQSRSLSLFIQIYAGIVIHLKI